MAQKYYNPIENATKAANINIDVDRFGSVQNGWLIAASAVLTVVLVIASIAKPSK